ncbi:MAG: hypothetical protein ABL886_08705, partial [Rhodoglobus sp.]
MAVAAVIVASIDNTLIDGTVLAWFLGIAFGVPIVSGVIDLIWWKFIAMPTVTVPQTRPEQLPRAWRIARAGDLFALLVVVLALIGLTRSLVPYIVIGLTDGTRIGLAADFVWLFVIISVVAVLGSASLLFFLPD